MDEFKERLLNLEKRAKVEEDFCVVGRLIGDLDEDTRAVLERVLKSSASTRSIWIELKNAGFRIDRNLIATHRQGKCFCIEGDSE